MTSDSAYLIIPVVLLVFAFRIWRTGGVERRVRIETMWIMPLIFILLVGSGIAASPPPMDPLIITILVIAAVAGLAVGWFRGRMVQITIEPETHTLKSRNSVMGMLVLAGLFLVRFGARELLTTHAADWHISLAAITDGFLILALGMIVGRRIEILIRCLGLLQQARQARAHGEKVPDEVTQDHG